MESEHHDPPAARGLWWRAVTVRATVGHPMDDVFAHLADPARWHAFVPAVVLRRRIGDDAAGVGSRWMATDRIGPFRLHFVDELAEIEPNRRVVWLSSAPWNGRTEYRCSGEGSVTRIEARYAGELSGSARWILGWVPAWAWRMILAQDFRRLDRLLSREARELERWHRGHAPVAVAAANLPSTDSHP